MNSSQVLKLQLVELEQAFQQQMREMQAQVQALQTDLGTKDRYIAHLERVSKLLHVLCEGEHCDCCGFRLN